MRTRAAPRTGAAVRPSTALPTARRDRSLLHPTTHAPRKRHVSRSVHRCVRGPAPPPAQREVLDLLGLVPTGAVTRLSLSDWRRVDSVADALAQARTRPAVIPDRGPEPAVR